MSRDPDLEGWMLGELTGVPGISTRPMFGGLGIMRGGNLIAGVRAGRLMLRLGPEGADEALALPGVTPMIHGGRRMRGYVFVELDAADDETRDRLVARAIMFSETLPDKVDKPTGAGPRAGGKPRKAGPRASRTGG